VNLEPGNGAWLVGPIAGIDTLGDQKSGHRRQARKAQSAIGGIVRKVIHVMRVSVVPLIARQFSGSL